MIDVEVLTIPGCPNAAATLREVRAILTEGRVRAKVSHTIVRDMQTVARLRFPGSPTVRVNGRDVEPSTTHVALSCRMYYDDAGRRGTPPTSTIRAALTAAREATRCEKRGH
ncbi:MAG: DF family (seleno)protein [Candidatus Binataceae bacterium]